MGGEDKGYKAEDVETGAYFIGAHRWYSEIFLSPIAERSYYLIVILLASLNFYFALASFAGVFPVNPSVPFSIYSNDIWNKAPHLRKLVQSSKEDKNTAVMKFMIKNYVTNRESYDLKFYEFRYRNIWTNSTPPVFEIYKNQIDASNSLSPYRQYTDVARRTIDIVSLDCQRTSDISHAHVVFKAVVTSNATGKEISHTKWQADIVYKYTDFKIDQRLTSKNSLASFFGLTGSDVRDSGEKEEVTPMTFLVSDYQLKELLE
jgi:type IV secretory pathway component VirB8